jgi:predicted nucleic-acid-binding Zn-ribbon protein
MRNGICPRCGHNDVRVGKDSDTMLGQPANVLRMQAVVGNIRAFYDVYVCLYCGYVELGLSDPSTLQRIANEWPRVGPPSQSYPA